MEGATSKDTWRRPTTSATRYPTQLAAWLYALFEVEQIVLDAHTSPPAPRSTTTLLRNAT